MKLKISDISKMSGIPASTIRYYVREGLLPAPDKVNKKMSYYDEACVERLKVIQYLQEKRYLPLFLIKNVMRRMDEGLSLQEAETIEKAVFNPVDGGDRTLIDRDAMLAETGLTEEQLKDAEDIGILMPFRFGDGKALYNEEDVRLCRDIIRRAIEFGLDLNDLTFYVKLGSRIMEQEMALRRKIVSEKTIRENIQITVELSSAVDFLREYVLRRLLRNQVEENIRKSLDKCKEPDSDHP